MYMKFAFLLFIVSGSIIANAQSLEPIDSIYLDGLPQFSKNITQITNQVWPGMTVGPYAVFGIDGPVFLKNHPENPAATSLTFEISKLEWTGY
jgi:hypothetical protein